MKVNGVEVKVGDRVEIVGERATKMNNKGFMDDWLGKIVTVKSTKRDYCSIEEDGCVWTWFESHIKRIVPRRNEEVL